MGWRSAVGPAPADLLALSRPAARGYGRTTQSGSISMRLFFGCILGWFLVAVTAGVAAWEVLAPNPAGGPTLRPAGQLWFELDRGSLNLVQAVIERYVWPPLWDPVIAGLLQMPAVLVPAVPAVCLAALCHWRRIKGLRVK